MTRTPDENVPKGEAMSRAGIEEAARSDAMARAHDEEAAMAYTYDEEAPVRIAMTRLPYCRMA